MVVIVGLQDLSPTNAHTAMGRAMDILAQTTGSMSGSAGSDAPSVIVSSTSGSSRESDARSLEIKLRMHSFDL